MIDLEGALSCAHQIADRAASAIEGKLVDVTHRKILAGTAFQLSTEHHHGMIILIENGALGPALALTRPVIENFARGHWLCYIASDEQVDRFARGNYQPKLDYLLRKLTERNPDGPTLETMQRVASRAHDLTHGGIGHLVRRIAPTRLGPSYTEEEVVAALRLATWTASMATVDLMGVVIEDKSLASVLVGEFRSLLQLPST